MCSFIDRFPAYKTLILRCISSCENKLQLACTYDMIDRFTEVFKLSVPHQQMTEALDELYTAYQEKDSATLIF